MATSVLAPNAAVSAPAPGHLDGTFIAGSFTSSQYQFNAQLFTGALPDFTSSSSITATPEPTSSALAGSSLIAIGLVCSRLRKK